MAQSCLTVMAVVREAMSSYWSAARMAGNRRGYFVRRSENIKSYIVSKAIDQLVSKPPRLPFMV